MTPDSTLAPAQRIAWIDVARGIAITLVVFHHSIQFLDATGWQVDALVQVTAALSTFRMPLFFLVSGLLASSAIARLSFASLFWKRLALLVYLYALWCIIWWAWFLFVPRPFDPLTSPVGDLATALYLPWSGLWFLYALILYTVAAWALRRLPRVAQLGIAFGVACLFATGIVTVGSSYTWRSVGTYFALFMTGVLCRQIVEAFARRVTVWWLLGNGAALAAGTVVLPFLPLQGVFRVALCVVGAAFGVSIAVMLARSPIARSAVGALGSRTPPDLRAQLAAARARGRDPARRTGAGLARRRAAHGPGDHDGPARPPRGRLDLRDLHPPVPDRPLRETAPAGRPPRSRTWPLIR